MYAARTLLGWQAQCANNFQKNGETSTDEAPMEEEAISFEESMQFTIYPNPSEGEVYLSYDLGDLASANLKIYDLSGKLIHTEILSTENMVVQLPGELFNAGVYLYHISDGKEMLGTGKFIVK